MTAPETTGLWQWLLEDAMPEVTPEPLCGWRGPAQPASLVLSHPQMPQISTALGENKAAFLR